MSSSSSETPTAASSATAGASSSSSSATATETETATASAEGSEAVAAAAAAAKTTTQKSGTAAVAAKTGENITAHGPSSTDKNVGVISPFLRIDTEKDDNDEVNSKDERNDIAPIIDGQGNELKNGEPLSLPKTTTTVTTKTTTTTTIPETDAMAPVSAVSQQQQQQQQQQPPLQQKPPQPAFNPISKWEEPVEIPSLTLFDINRKPRRVNHNPNARIKIPLKVLSAEFHCPVCLGYIKKTSIVMECLHRFCGECIQKCLRLGKKECPSCRVHIPSRRSLRPDPKFDELIKSIYGKIDELEKTEEKEIETVNKAKNMNNAYAESRKLGIMQQAMNRKKKAMLGKIKTTGNSGRVSSGGTKRKASGFAPIVGLEEDTKIDFILRKHPQETIVHRLDREYLRTAGDMTVEILKVFLGQKLSYQPSSHFEILVTAGGRGLILDDCITIEEIRRQICDFGDTTPPIIHYRINPNY